MSVLPRRLRGNTKLTDTEIVDASIELGTVDPVSITDQASDRGVESDRVHDLSSRPLGIRMSRHIDVQDAASLERQDEEDLEHVEGHSRYRQKLDGDCAREMGPHELPPGHRSCSTRISRLLAYVLRNRVLAHLGPELGECGGKPTAAPEWIVGDHPRSTQLSRQPEAAVLDGLVLHALIRELY